MNFRKSALFLLVIVLVSGCAAERSRSSFSIFSSNYEIAVDKKLRNAKLYNQFETIVIMDGIYNDKELRNVWVKEQARIKRLAPEDIQKLTAEEKSENEKSVQFILAVYTS